FAPVAQEPPNERHQCLWHADMLRRPRLGEHRPPLTALLDLHDLVRAPAGPVLYTLGIKPCPERLHVVVVQYVAAGHHEPHSMTLALGGMISGIGVVLIEQPGLGHLALPSLLDLLGSRLERPIVRRAVVR